MSPDELAKLLQPISDAGIEITATAAAALLASIMGCYREQGEAQQTRMIEFIVSEADRMYRMAVEREQKIKRAIAMKPSGSVH